MAGLPSGAVGALSLSQLCLRAVNVFPSLRW